MTIPADTPCETPVVFIIFNRPQETRRVFEAIRKVRPKRLFLIADAPRFEAEAGLCAETKKVVEELIDWPCAVERNYAEKNLGVRLRLSSGINWVFDHVDRAIFLEADVLPDPTFFRFCEELLERYADNPRVMHITGSSIHEKNAALQRTLKKEGASYFFSLCSHIYGWATWRRAWKHYDLAMRSWPDYKKIGSLAARFHNPAAYERFSMVWDKYHAGAVNSWDGPWTYAIIAQNGCAINPSTNLITYIGNDSGLHVETGSGKTYAFADASVHPMRFPLIHPKEIVIQDAADAYTYRHVYGIDSTLWKRLVRPIKTHLPFVHALYRRLKKRSI